VINEEKRAIRDACDQYQSGYHPTITVIIVTKRHNRRFFEVAPGGGIVNCPPGTIIDNTVTRPDITDFYLQSHCPLQVQLFNISNYHI
jgi:eukaryotic translation initiation factor 2C